MKMKLLFYSIAFFFSISLFSQVNIEMKRIDGILQVPCKVNGIPMNFIFDTGASDVSISITEAKFLIKQGLLTEDNFIGNVNYKIANGDIIEGTQVYLKTINIGGNVIKNVRASIIHEQNSPLLFGQSAISKLGQYSINGNTLILQNGNKDDTKTIITTSSEKKDNTKEAVDFLNIFLNEENWASITKGGFKYDSYSNSLAYKSEFSLKNDSKNRSIYNEYAFRIDNVKYIEEVIYKADKSDITDFNYIFYDIFFINDIYYKFYEQDKSVQIPNYENSKVNNISIDIEKNITLDDIKDIQLVIRDIFLNIPIKTKFLDEF